MRAALRSGLGLLAAAGVAAGLLPGPPGSAAPACKPTAVPSDEAVLSAMVAAKRHAAKLVQVSPDGVLSRAGRRKSLQMAGGAKFAHGDSMGWANGRAGAQNIAMAPSAREAFSAMWASAPHRRNILGAAWRLSGIGAARDCAGQTFYTLNFAAPAG